MGDISRSPKLSTACLLSMLGLLGFAAVGCSEIHPEPNMEEGGMVESPTEENEPIIQEEEQHLEDEGLGGERRR